MPWERPAERWHIGLSDFGHERPISDISARAAGRRPCSWMACVLLFSWFAGNFGPIFRPSPKKSFSSSPAGAKNSEEWRAIRLRMDRRYRNQGSAGDRGVWATECSAWPDTRATVPASGGPSQRGAPVRVRPGQGPSCADGRQWVQAFRFGAGVTDGAEVGVDHGLCPFWQHGIFRIWDVVLAALPTGYFTGFVDKGQAQHQGVFLAHNRVSRWLS